MNDIGYFIALAVIFTLFAVLWRKGQLTRLAVYVSETREELRKCTWPTAEELKGSTVVVLVAIVLLGSFTVFVDFAITQLVRLITQL